jgi:hypothetical protein
LKDFEPFLRLKNVHAFRGHEIGRRCNCEFVSLRTIARLDFLNETERSLAFDNRV